MQFKGGHQAFGQHLNLADAHRHTQRKTGLCFQARAKITDTRHNEAMQQAPAEYHHHPKSKDQPQQSLKHAGKQPDMAGWWRLGMKRSRNHGLWNYDGCS